MTHACCSHPNPDLAGPRRIQLEGLDPDRHARPIEDGGADQGRCHGRDRNGSDVGHPRSIARCEIETPTKRLRSTLGAHCRIWDRHAQGIGRPVPGATVREVVDDPSSRCALRRVHSRDRAGDLGGRRATGQLTLGTDRQGPPQDPRGGPDPLPRRILRGGGPPRRREAQGPRQARWFRRQSSQGDGEVLAGRGARARRQGQGRQPQELLAREHPRRHRGPEARPEAGDAPGRELGPRAEDLSAREAGRDEGRDPGRGRRSGVGRREGRGRPGVVRRHHRLRDRRQHDRHRRRFQPSGPRRELSRQQPRRHVQPQLQLVGSVQVVRR